MKEIGGYFGLEELIGKEYYSDLIAVNNARNALHYIIKAKKYEKIYIPCFLCDSVSKLLNKIKCQIEYYNIDSNFKPIFDKIVKEKECVYIVNYYGQLNDTEIVNYQKQYKNIIFDNVQAFFQKPVEGIDTIYSCRKFFGVPDGAYLSTDKTLNEELISDCSQNRMKHILGRFESGKASDYYEVFKNNDSSFVDSELKMMSRITHNILGAVDYERVFQKRTNNYQYLSNKFHDINKLKLSNPIAPYVYPLYCENGLDIKRKLAEKKIYVPTLWPNVLNLENILEKDYAENILPLPIDQRYDEYDMEYVAREVIKCINCER